MVEREIYFLLGGDFFERTTVDCSAAGAGAKTVWINQLKWFWNCILMKTGLTVRHLGGFDFL